MLIQLLVKRNQIFFDIVIANDGSVDNTAVVCDELSEKHKNVHVYHKENEGLIKT